MIEERAAIETYWKGVIAAGLRNLSLRSVRVDYRGNAAMPAHLQYRGGHYSGIDGVASMRDLIKV